MALVKKGYIKRTSNATRSMQLIRPLVEDSCENKERIKSLYWLIKFQEHFVIMSELFDIKAFNDYANASGINIESEDDKENIAKIKQEYHSL
jgi:hypothetical protein